MEKINLDALELQEVLKWVDSYILSRPSKKLSRDFSDAVLLAEILKNEFPKLVQLHNYVGCSSVKAKIKNWDALNQKVLRKIKINLKHDEIEKLAKAEGNCIEQLLYVVMKTVETSKQTQEKASPEKHNTPMKKHEPITENTSVGDDTEKENSSDTIEAIEQIGDSANIADQFISDSAFEELQQEYESLKSYTSDLEEEIKQLRSELDFKTQTIQDLNARVAEPKKKGSFSIRKSLANLF